MVSHGIRHRCTPQPVFFWSSPMPGKIQWSQHRLLFWRLAVWMLKVDKRKSSVVEFGHEVLMTSPEPIIFDRSNACLDFRWFQCPLRVSECAVCHVIPQPAIFGGSYRTLSVSTFYDSILSLYTCFCVFAMCICFLAVNWWLIILCKAWWDFNLPGDCSCVVAKKRWKQSQGSEPCDMFLQWKSPLDSRSSQLLKTAIWCTY